NLKGVVYKKSDITIDDDFIKGKMASLLGSDSSEENDSKKIFIQVNRELRTKNDNTIKEIGSKSSDSIKWKGAFHQLSNSQVEANFADERTYYINGEPIDQQYHLGYDLAVTKRYPIEAANDGAVVFTGDLGIYGNSIIIDHGMGVMTLYGHVSSIDVKEGDSIKKSQIIGRTGETGLAVGDHLHYGVYINGVPVRPIEWWDEKWINDNIILKIKTAEAEFGSKQIKTEASPEKSSQETDKKVEN
ncbi:MAG: M23 family metallopeptidase, partial [Thermodesulfobacteriota bacterium]